MQDPCLMRNKAIVKINLQKDILRINHLKPYLVDFDIKCPSYVNVPLWFCFSWLASLGFNIKIFDLNSTSECIRDFNKYKLIRWFDTSITASKNTLWHFISNSLAFILKFYWAQNYYTGNKHQPYIVYCQCNTNDEQQKYIFQKSRNLLLTCCRNLSLTCFRNLSLTCFRKIPQTKFWEREQQKKEKKILRKNLWEKFNYNYLQTSLRTQFQFTN